MSHRNLVAICIGLALCAGVALTLWKRNSHADVAAIEARILSVGEEQELTPKDEFQECKQCPRMVVVPAGRFVMGEKGGEGPLHEVTIARQFAVGKFEVTFAEWEACVADGGCARNPAPSDAKWGRERRPIIDVSWLDASEYISWLAAKTGKGYRMLTEAEWEYVARSRTTTRFPWGELFSSAQANNDKGKTVPVGQYPANSFGLHDTQGNVWEWVEDCWQFGYKGALTDGSPRLAGDCKTRVLRGGSWSTEAGGLRSASRFREQYDFRGTNIGFRVARTL